MNMTTASPDQASGPGAWLRKAEAWLDARGRGAWIAAFVLGFIFFWPAGLAILLYMTFTNRWSKEMFGTSCRRAHGHMHGHMHTLWARHGALRPSGNRAFDAYKAETLRRLEDEQQAFETFLERLRAAKDKTEFDSFMEERAREAAAGTGGADEPSAISPPPASPAPGAAPRGY
jgi:hypothetical protein